MKTPYGRLARLPASTFSGKTLMVGVASKEYYRSCYRSTVASGQADKARAGMTF